MQLLKVKRPMEQHDPTPSHATRLRHQPLRQSKKGPSRDPSQAPSLGYASRRRGLRQHYERHVQTP